MENIFFISMSQPLFPMNQTPPDCLGTAPTIDFYGNSKYFSHILIEEKEKLALIKCYALAHILKLHESVMGLFMLKVMCLKLEKLSRS
jgi:hypothetical protein